MQNSFYLKLDTQTWWFQDEQVVRSLRSVIVADLRFVWFAIYGQRAIYAMKKSAKYKQYKMENSKYLCIRICPIQRRVSSNVIKLVTCTYTILLSISSRKEIHIF